MKTLKSRMMNNKTAIILLLALTCLAGVLSAQYTDDDKLMFQAYTLPDTALPDSVMTEVDSVMYLDGEVFTGTAFSRYDNGQLQHASVYLNGRKHGTTFVWYPDGKPQLMATYRNGWLNGRFKGWYQFGAVIYDLVMREGKYTGDSLYDADASRGEVTSEDSGREGDAPEAGND
jgi:antitoxin component YwqK of YwqJK toxin-antitoxin module